MQRISKLGRHIDADDVALYASGALAPGDANAHHVTMRPASDGGIARTPAEMRHAAQIIHAHARGLFAFRVADTHVHMLLLGGRAAAGRTAQAVEVALRAGLGIPVAFERARIRPIEDQGHLARALRYVLQQEKHHGTDLDPAHDGSSLPDLLGLRVLGDGALFRRVRTHLPRLEAAEVRRWGDLEEIERFPLDPRHLCEAAAGAFALRDVATNTPRSFLARCAAAHALPLPSGELARWLGVDARSVRRLRLAPAPAPSIRAVDLQLRLRTAIAMRARGW